MGKIIIRKNKNHSMFHCFLMVLFIVSLGFGEAVAVGPIKVSYITTALLFVYSIVFRIGADGLSNRKYRQFLYFSIIWVIYGGIQVLWAQDMAYWWAFYRTLIINMLIVFLILKFINDSDDWNVVCKSFIVLAVICLAVGLWEINTGQHVDVIDYNRMNEATAAYYRNKPSSFFGNVNDNASVLFLGLVAALMMYSSNEKKGFLKKVFYLGFCALTIYELIVIDSRGVIYSLVFMIICLAFFKLRDNATKNNAGMGKMMLLFVAFAAFFIIISLLAFNGAEYYLGMISKGGDYASDIRRLSIIRNGWEAFIESFGFGVGPGQSLLASGINLHSFHLELLVEYGVLIGGYMLLVIFRLAFEKDDLPKSLNKLLIESFPFVLIILGISSSKLVSLRPFWVTFALLYAYKYNSFSKEDLIIGDENEFKNVNFSKN